MSATSTISVEIDDLPQCEVFDARKEHKATVFFLHVRIKSQILAFPLFHKSTIFLFFQRAWAIQHGILDI
jgi:hypothetical protein